MSEDFGYQRDEEQSRAGLIIKRAFMIGAILFSVSCFIYITISAYYFVYHDQNNGVAIIKSPDFPIKIIQEENKGGIAIKDMDKTVYENIVGNNKKEFLEKGTIKAVQVPEKPIASESKAAKQIKDRDIVKLGLVGNNKKPSDSKLIVYDSNTEFQTIDQSTKNNVDSGTMEMALPPKVSGEILKNNTPVKPKKNVSRVQLAAMNSTNSADEYWSKLNNKYSRLFSGLKHFVQEVKLGQKGTFYRLQIGDFRSQVEAEEFCVKFISEAQKTRSDCIVVE